MKKIKRMNIIGFKKFKKFNIEFNDEINIIIGDNESGKSTLLSLSWNLVLKIYHELLLILNLN